MWLFIYYYNKLKITIFIQSHFIFLLLKIKTTNVLFANNHDIFLYIAMGNDNQKINFRIYFIIRINLIFEKLFFKTLSVVEVL